MDSDKRGSSEIIIQLPAEVSQGFWTFKGHFFGTLTFSKNGIIYEGHRRTFTLKKIKLTVNTKLEEINEITFSGSRIVKVRLNNNKTNIFMLGKGTVNEFGAPHSSYMLSTAAAGNLGADYHELSRTVNNEKILERLISTLNSSNYAKLINENVTGVRTSKLIKYGFIGRYAYGIIFFLITIITIVFVIKKYS
jgi:hypothetical protein